MSLRASLSHASRTPVRAPPYNPPACAKGHAYMGDYGGSDQPSRWMISRSKKATG